MARICCFCCCCFTILQSCAHCIIEIVLINYWILDHTSQMFYFRRPTNDKRWHWNLWSPYITSQNIFIFKLFPIFPPSYLTSVTTCDPLRDRFECLHLSILEAHGISRYLIGCFEWRVRASARTARMKWIYGTNRNVDYMWICHIMFVHYIVFVGINHIVNLCIWGKNYLINFICNVNICWWRHGVRVLTAYT